MSDHTVKPEIVRQKQVTLIATLKATVERQRLELMEMDQRRSTNEENIEASLKKIGELEEELEKL